MEIEHYFFDEIFIGRKRSLHLSPIQNYRIPKEYPIIHDTRISSLSSENSN